LWFASDGGGSLRGRNHVRDLFPDLHALATPKPEELLQRVIHIGLDPGDIMLDCHGGSGTTAAVAPKTGRRWVTCDLNPVTVAAYAKVLAARPLTRTQPAIRAIAAYWAAAATQT
jgi:adenine-specific DNA-methyltransferase